MSKRKDKVPGTKTQPEPQQAPEETILPIEIMFHIAGCRVERLSDEVLELSLISPTGIGVTARMSQENANELAQDLAPRSDAPKVDVFTTLPGLPK